MTSWALFPTVYKTGDNPHVLPCVPKREVPGASCRAQGWHWKYLADHSRKLHPPLCFSILFNSLAGEIRCRVEKPKDLGKLMLHVMLCRTRFWDHVGLILV